MGTFTIRPAEQQDVIDALNDTNIKNTNNALAPYSGYAQVSKKLDNFVFQTSSSFLNKVADKNRFVKFGDKVVDTYGPELVPKEYTNLLNISRNGGSSNVSGFNIACTIGKIYRIESNITVATSGTNAGLYADGYINIEQQISSIGKQIIIFKALTSTVSIRQLIEINVYGIASFTGISVREIKTADFTNTVPDVAEVITNGSNTTSVAVSAGDYVVDGSELVTNGTFDTDTSGWTGVNATLSRDTGVYTNGGLTITNTSINGYAYKVIQVVPNVKNIIKSLSTSGSGTPQISIRALNNDGAEIAYVAGANGIVIFTPTTSTVSVRLICIGASSTYVSFDNISVKRVSDTFRAKQDAPIGTALTNTTYFEDRTQIGVTNQGLAYHAYNTLTNAYEGIKTEVLFSDVSKEDLLDNSVWMARNGFSKVSQFLYSKGSYLVLPVGIWQSLNKGAYHPILNPFGTSIIWRLDGTVSGLYWYHPDAKKIDIVAKCFDSSIGTNISGEVSPFVRGDRGMLSSGVTGRPSSVNYAGGEYYDICYPDQFIDVREYAKILNRDEVNLIIADKEENGVEEVVFTEQVLQTTTGTVATLEVSNGTYYKVGSVLQIWNGTTGYRRYVASVSGNTVTLDSTIVKTAVNFIIGGGKKPILSSNTKLSNMVYGNPQFYPQVLKDRLASGVGVVGLEPVLIEN